MISVVAVIGYYHHFVPPCAIVGILDIFLYFRGHGKSFSRCLDRKAANGNVDFRVAYHKSARLHILKHTDIVIIGERVYLRVSIRGLPDQHGRISTFQSFLHLMPRIESGLAHQETVFKTLPSLTVVPHLHDSAKRAEIGTSSGEFVINIVGKKNMDRHSVDITVQLRDLLGALAEIGKRDDNHIRDGKRVQVLIGYTSSGLTSSGLDLHSDRFGIESDIFMIAFRGYKSRLRPIETTVHKRRGETVCHIPYLCGSRTTLHPHFLAAGIAIEEVELAVPERKTTLIEHLYIVESGMEQRSGIAEIYLDVEFVSTSLDFLHA